MNDLDNVKVIGSKIASVAVLIVLVLITFGMGIVMGTNDEHQAEIDTKKEITANETKVEDAKEDLETVKKEKEEIETKISDIEKFLEEAEESAE